MAVDRDRRLTEDGWNEVLASMLCLEQRRAALAAELSIHCEVIDPADPVLQHLRGEVTSLTRRIAALRGALLPAMLVGFADEERDRPTEEPTTRQTGDTAAEQSIVEMPEIGPAVSRKRFERRTMQAAA